MSTADRIYLLVKHSPEAQARKVLEFVESILCRFRQPSAPTATQTRSAAVELDGNLSVTVGQSIPTGAQSLEILKRNGFVGGLQADPELSSRYKEELDWSDKV